MHKTLIDWTQEVEKYSTEWNERLKNNPATKEMYYGFKVWYSEMVESPEVLFIGINPGKGDFDGGKKRYSVDAGFHQKFTYIDYLDKEYNYPLAQQTTSVLEMAGVMDCRAFFKRCLKTNFYHIVTEDAAGIKKTIDAEGKGWAAFNTKCYEQMKDLIEISKPKLIVCEGSSVFDTLKYGYAVISKTPMTDFQEVKGISQALLPNGVQIVAYSRTFSTIQDKQELSELLSKFISPVFK